VVDPVEGAGRQKWSLTQEAFDGLLARLHPDRDTAADRYLDIRRNLVRLFEWRGCSTPDEYADETINRCAKKIGEGEEIRDLPTYSIGVARMLVREMSRERARDALSLDDAPEPRILLPESKDAQEAREGCLRRCLGHLSSENRDLILSYYQGDKGEKIKNRKGLTQLFRIPSNVLRMRALRVREKLQLCVESCLERQGENWL
jgi:DNA-directed RNA polymerase specialized sigma24 family protein